MSTVANIMHAHGFTPAINNHGVEGFTTETFSYGNSEGIILANFCTRNRNRKILVSVDMHSGAGWITKDIFLSAPDTYFNTERQRKIIDRRIARMVRKLNG